jgi:asparagine synthase (glutamine-hydrolysing)
MCAALSRRGPDAQGLEQWDRAVLAHRRLSIFDLSDAGRQPMMLPDRSAAVVFNGAIYNFHQLRSDLETGGACFRSNTDTEVLLHGFRAWGIDRLVARLRGMFAFCLWDNNEERAFLVRDRLGVKPLVYTAKNGVLAFASTVRALCEGGYAAEIDEQGVVEFLEYGFVTDDRTIYRDVSKVQAATILEWHGGRLSSRRFWQPPSIREDQPWSFDEAVEETERLFLRAVELRLHADVPVGALLSGGVDSSLVCWAISHLGGDITAFTVGAPGDPLDETEDARATARDLNIQHRVLTSSAEDCGIEEMVSAYAEPFACASALGMLQVSRAVKQEATVLLTGDGGDDVFLGYPEHRHFEIAQQLARRLPRSAPHYWPMFRHLLPQVGLLRRATHFLDYATGGLAGVTNAHDGLPFYRHLCIAGERLAAARLARRELSASHESARNLLTDFLQYDFRTRFTGEYMTKVDGGAMHYALEARSPFLDHELWEFAAALPYRIRLRGGQLKAVLRELARRRLGDRVAFGPKRGFGIPVGRWVTGRWRQMFERTFQNSILEQEGWIRSDPLLERLRATAPGEAAPKQFWYLLILEAWFRHSLKTPGVESATLLTGS